jgi:hypothetical protein
MQVLTWNFLFVGVVNTAIRQICQHIHHKNMPVSDINRDGNKGESGDLKICLIGHILVPDTTPKPRLRVASRVTHKIRTSQVTLHPQMLTN